MAEYDTQLCEKMQNSLAKTCRAWYNKVSAYFSTSNYKEEQYGKEKSGCAEA
ncbi:MAG: hypothetical protein IKK51_06220 [Oscillospiraceae bacterium]|nr:hypothetical protein [Oscillospiraceae bacterium]